MTKHKYDCIDTLRSAGISYDDAVALRRISMTLHRWHELECGDSNAYASWCITHGAKMKDGGFMHDDDGKPYLERHYYTHGAGKDSVTYTPIADRERGALKRLGAIMARYPGFSYHIQPDPRGCSLYILRPGDIPSGACVDASYNRGIAVFK